MRSIPAGLVGAALAAAALPAAPRASALDDVLARAGAYSLQLGRDLTAVVADEEYLQELAASATSEPFEARRLESEIAFVVLEDRHWMTFRMVKRVDGKDVGGDPAWLEQLFRLGPQSARDRARSIAAESARYNLGDLRREVNSPSLVQQFLLPANQTRFRFSKKREEQAGSERLWVIEYKEQSRGTIIRTPSQDPVPARGMIWIDPSAGHLVRATLELEKPVPTEIEFSWRVDPKMGVWVPAEMRERYRPKPAVTQGNRGPHEIRGLARYANYRRFEADFRIR